MLKIIVLSAIVCLAGCATSNVATKSDAPYSTSSSPARPTAAEPTWFNSPDALYPDYVTGVGTGVTQSQADQQALANLVSYFSQKVQAELTSVERDFQTTSNGKTQSSNSSQVENSIQTAAAMDKLIGAEIKERGDDGRTYYALAALEKRSGVRSYSDLLASNQQQIDQLIANISSDDKNSFTGYSRYLQAAKIADENAVYGSVLSLLDGQSRQLATGTQYRIEAASIIENIPVAVNVTNDKSDRIRGAFAGVLQKQGFRSGGNNSRYVLNVTVEISAVEGTSPNKFARYEIDARLTDTTTGNVLVPFNINGREGHTSISEAENRAIRAAEQEITKNYSAKLTEYFSTL
jgi:hypothetical protein